MFYTETTETTCKTVCFSGIYVLYVNNGAQKIYFFGFGYWRPRVWVPPLRPKSAFCTRKTAYFAGFRLFFLCFIIIGRSPFLSLIRTSRKAQDTGDRFRWFVPCIFNIFRKNAILCLLRCKFWGVTVAFRQPFAFVFSPINWNLAYCFGLIQHVLPKLIHTNNT